MDSMSMMIEQPPEAVIITCPPQSLWVPTWLQELLGMLAAFGMNMGLPF